MKHASGISRVGKFMKQWEEWQEDHCPRCDLPEDTEHVWRCQGRGTNDVWGNSLDILQNWLNRVGTDPNITHFIITALNEWRYDHPIQVDSVHCIHFLQAQEAIG